MAYLKDDDSQVEQAKRKKMFDKMLANFEDADKDGDGFLTQEEHRAVFEASGADMLDKSLQTYMQQQWESLDKDGDGQVSIEEYFHAMKYTGSDITRIQ